MNLPNALPTPGNTATRTLRIQPAIRIFFELDIAYSKRYLFFVQIDIDFARPAAARKGNLQLLQSALVDMAGPKEIELRLCSSRNLKTLSLTLQFPMKLDKSQRAS